MWKTYGEAFALSRTVVLISDSAPMPHRNDIWKNLTGFGRLDMFMQQYKDTGHYLILVFQNARSAFASVKKGTVNGPFRVKNTK
jgi:hypothetical protein